MAMVIFSKIITKLQVTKQSMERSILGITYKDKEKLEWITHNKTSKMSVHSAFREKKRKQMYH